MVIRNLFAGGVGVNEVLKLLALVIGSDALQELAAAPVGSWLKAHLPDVTEANVASFLRRVAQHLSPV